MLGEKIKFLSATDTWLILEAAYNHDIGMVVTQKQLSDINSEEFKSYLKEIIDQPDNPLHSFAKDWENNKAILPTGSESHSFLNRYIQLIAEWYRKKHPENSAKIVVNPVDEIGLNSPRNELLPKRLFGALSKVCQAHGQGFSEVMKLPFSEAGMASEDCHPRYVACLLRMADLLDLDDNRFCPVMLHMCGERLPETSKAHLDKHHSIKHFRLDSERIEAESECPSPEAYEVAFEWFKWLETEYHQQTQNWDKIVPSKKLGNLPTLTTPSVKIKEPFLILEQGKKPNFRVDQKAILDLVRSTGLYTSKFESIREALQNAVDATLIAIWQMHKSEILYLDPTHPRMREIFDQYPITVEIEETPNNEKFILLRITDQGTGIDFETLKYMLEVGASYKNRSKRSIVEEMPVWYRPSGNFGIGLQSSYLISNKFTIKSKSRLTHEALKLSFSQKSEKSIVIKKISSQSMGYGTTLEMKIKIKKFPQSMQFGFSDDSLLAQRLNEYDFTKPGASLRCYEIIKIYESIAKFNQESPIKINHSSIKPHVSKESYFCKKSNIVLTNLNFNNTEHSILETFFRGQEFQGFSYYFHCMRASIDFYGHSAKDFLTYNREKILPHAARKAHGEIITAVLSYIDNNELSEEQKPYAAAFCQIYANAVPPKLERYLPRYEVQFTDGSTKTLEKLTAEIKSGDCKFISTPGHETTIETSSSILAKNKVAPALDLIIHFVLESGFHYQISGHSSPFKGESYKWSAQSIEPLSEDLFKDLLLQKYGINHGVGNRVLFPCWGQYKKLAIKAKISWAKVFSPTRNKNEFMVLPCHFLNIGQPPVFHDNEELARWTYKNRKYDESSEAEILTLYNDLSLRLKNLIGAGR